MTDFSKWKCRSSAISKMMSNSKDNAPLTDNQAKELAELEAKPTRTEKQGLRITELVLKQEKSKDVILSDTAIAYLVEAYAWETEKMCSITKEMDVEYFERGRKTEPESIELLSFVDDGAYIKNEERFENEFLSGIPDVLHVSVDGAAEGQEEWFAETIVDIKSTKDYPTFLYKMHKGLDPGNREQLQGYGDILDCLNLKVAFTLPTMPESIRNGYKMKLAYKMDEVTTESPRFLKAWAELERSMIFDHIPAPRRVYKIPVEPFTLSEKQAVYERVKVCREWLNNFHLQYQRLNS